MADNHRVPTSIDRALLRALEAQWDNYRRALRPADQAVFDRLVEHARAHGDVDEAQTDVSGTQPQQFVEQLLFDQAALVSILIEQQKQLDDLDDRLEYMEEDLNDG
jgi:hypothetical protein